MYGLNTCCLCFHQSLSPALSHTEKRMYGAGHCFNRMPGWFCLVFLKKNRSLNFFFFFHVVTDFLKRFEFESIYELLFFSTFKFRFLLQIEAFAKLNTQWRKITTAYARSRRTPQSAHDIIWAVLQFRLTIAPASVEIKPWNKQLTKRENNLKLTGDEGHL